MSSANILLLHNGTVADESVSDTDPELQPLVHRCFCHMDGLDKVLFLFQLFGIQYPHRINGIHLSDISSSTHFIYLFSLNPFALFTKKI